MSTLDEILALVRSLSNSERAKLLEHLSSDASAKTPDDRRVKALDKWNSLAGSAHLDGPADVSGEKCAQVAAAYGNLHKDEK